jgi:hypothetical protein
LDSVFYVLLDGLASRERNAEGAGRIDRTGGRRCEQRRIGEDRSGPFITLSFGPVLFSPVISALPPIAPSMPSSPQPLPSRTANAKFETAHG